MTTLIADELRAVADELTAAGITATTDPDLVGQTISQAGYVALVDLPAISAVALGGRLHLDVPVRLLVAPPGGPAQWSPAWAVLPAAQAALHAPTAVPGPHTIGTIAYPAYTLTTARRL